jgi:hypothetical protein
MLHVISLGAGVQSTTIALMAAAGVITPMPDCAIFADTQAEPKDVYRHLDWLERQLPFPVHRVTAGSLREQIVAAMKGRTRMDGRPPFYTSKGGVLIRQCTGDFKLKPIQRKQRELVGLKPGQRRPKQILMIQWIGISTDEAARMKPSQVPFVQHRWPLIEAGMNRRACLAWCRKNGFPEPPKSACTFCPFHGDQQWRAMKASNPEAFADAVAIDEMIRPGLHRANWQKRDDHWFVHRSRHPLAEVDFSTAEDRGQLNLFNNECEGVCGV